MKVCNWKTAQDQKKKRCIDYYHNLGADPLSKLSSLPKGAMACPQPEDFQRGIKHVENISIKLSYILKTQMLHRHNSKHNSCVTCLFCACDFELSIQRAAVWLLDHYYSDFPVYNPVLPNLPKSILSKKMTGFKVYSLDGKYTLNMLWLQFVNLLYCFHFVLACVRAIYVQMMKYTQAELPVFLVCPSVCVYRKPHQQLHWPVQSHDSSGRSQEGQLPQRALLRRGRDGTQDPQTQGQVRRSAVVRSLFTRFHLRCRKAELCVWTVLQNEAS